MNFVLSYTPGFSVSQHESDQFQQTQNLGAQWAWTPSRRLMVRLRQDFSISTNPFEQVGREPLLPGLGGLFGPYYNNVLPNTKRTTLVSGAEVMVRLSPHSAVGFSGGYQSFDYQNLPNLSTVSSLPLVSSHTFNASAYYSQQLSRQMTIGVQYALFDMYSDPDSRTQAHDVLLFDTLHLTSKQSLTVYGGPEYARSHSLETVQLNPSMFLTGEVTSRSWRPSAGLTYAWTGSRNALELQFVRRLDSGNGLMNAESMTNGSVAVRSRFAKRSTVEGRVQVSDQEAFGSTTGSTSATEQSFRSTWLGVGVTRELSSHLSARLDYADVRQNGSSTNAPANHQLVQLSLGYHLVKPIGR